MRILVITGLLAEGIIREQIFETEHEVEVLVMPVPVAAFISAEIFLEYLRKSTLEYDLILFPGSTEGDLSLIENVTGIPTFKGPYHAADLNLTLKNLQFLTLSKKTPSSDLLKAELENNVVSKLREVEENWEKNLDKYGGFRIGTENNKLAIGFGLPIRVIAEIVNAPTLDYEALKRLTVYYENEGADIIDIGMLAGNPKPNTVEGIIDTVRDSSNLPLSIDSLEPTEINVAIDSGIDLVMSIDAGNMRLLSEKARSIPVVVLPSNMKEGIFPREPITRIDYLEKNIENAKRLGYQKIIADPVLEPPITPGLINSLRNYITFRERDKTTPLLMGIGNVVEMVDFDSVGVNGLLTAIAQELNVQLIHVPEHSVKAKKSIKEATTAVKMTFLAENRKTVLKDLGIDLLKLKEKRWLEEKYEQCFEENTKVIHGSTDHKYQSDKAGWFKIQIDRIEKKVILTHFPIQSETPDMIIKGTNARDLYLTSMKMGNITRMDHAAYLGKELMKAEIALKLERSYIQDEPLFQ